VKLLLDTHAFLWAVMDDKRLSRKARARFTAADSGLFLSVASAWEISIKAALGKLKLPDSPKQWLIEQLAINQIDLLNVSFDHVVHVYSMPAHHGDPFDRLLCSQALLESLPILSADESFDAYGIERVW